MLTLALQINQAQKYSKVLNYWKGGLSISKCLNHKLNLKCIKTPCYRIENIFKKVGRCFGEDCFDENNWEHFSSLLGKIIVKLVGVDKLSPENKLQPAVSEKNKNYDKIPAGSILAEFFLVFRDMALTII